MNKENPGYALKLFGKLVVVTVLNFFICISFMFICTAAFTENIGYTAVVYDNENNEVERYNYYYADGDDLRLSEYPEDNGYQISKQALRSGLSHTGTVLFRVLSQVFAFCLLTGFIYPSLWQLGAKDSNAVKFQRRASDPLRGLKIGILAQLPAALLLLVCVCFWRNVPLRLYALLNSSFYALIDIIGGGKSFAQLGTAGIIALFALLLPAVGIAAAAYWLGFKDISLGEHFVYSKINRQKNK